MSCLLIAKWGSCYFISPLSEIAAFGLDISPRGQHVQRTDHPQHGKSKRVFRLLLARCILSSFKSLSTFLSSLSLQKSSCHLLVGSAIAAVPLQKRNILSLESLLKSSPGLKVGGDHTNPVLDMGGFPAPAQCTSDIGTVSFHCFCSFLSPCVPVLFYRESDHDVNSAESAKCWCFPLAIVFSSRKRQ